MRSNSSLTSKVYIKMSGQIKAAILTGSTEKNQLTEVKEIPFPKIQDDQILIKAVSYAANPTDWKHAVSDWGKKGNISGSDASGVVEQVGSKVTGYSKGDVVSTFLHGNYYQNRGAFSEYVIADPDTTIKYNIEKFRNEPLSVGNHKFGPIDSYEGAASVTLGLVTVALSFAHNLHISTDRNANASKYILIWSGSTATGFLAIQVAKLVYGLNVITTASKKNHDVLKSIGADHVLDYKDKDVVEQIKKIGGENIHYALDTFSTEESLQSVYDATENTKDVVIDNLLFLNENSIKTNPSRNVKFTQTLAYLVMEDQKLGSMVVPTNEELKKDYREFWHKALPPHIKDIKHNNLKVMEPGFKSVNPALELLREDKVSGEKIVFRASSD